MGCNCTGYGDYAYMDCRQTTGYDERCWLFVDGRGRRYVSGGGSRQTLAIAMAMAMAMDIVPEMMDIGPEATGDGQGILRVPEKLGL